MVDATRDSPTPGGGGEECAGELRCCILATIEGSATAGGASPLDARVHPCPALPREIHFMMGIPLFPGRCKSSPARLSVHLARSRVPSLAGKSKAISLSSHFLFSDPRHPSSSTLPFFPLCSGCVIFGRCVRRCFVRPVASAP